MTTYQRTDPKYLSDQDLLTIRFDGEEWQRLYEAVAFSEDGKGIAERIYAETIQDGRLSWEMAFTIQEWLFLVDQAEGDPDLEDAAETIDDLLQQHGWSL